jgi:hypothetical protein
MTTTTATITYLTEAAYWKRYNALSARASKAEGRWARWNTEVHRLPYGTSASNRAFDARDNARSALVDASNALYRFERDFAIRPAAR